MSTPSITQSLLTLSEAKQSLAETLTNMGITSTASESIPSLVSKAALAEDIFVKHLQGSEMSGNAENFLGEIIQCSSDYSPYISGYFYKAVEVAPFDGQHYEWQQIKVQDTIQRTGQWLDSVYIDDVGIYQCLDDYNGGRQFKKGYFYEVYIENNTVKAREIPTLDISGKVDKIQGIAHAGEFLVVDSNGEVTPMSLQTWQGGNY